MATAILDLEFNQLPPGIDGLGAYQQALVLLRLHGTPVARFTIPVTEGRISKGVLEQAIVDNTDAHLFCEYWLQERLDLRENASLSRLPSMTIATCTRDRPDDLRRCLEGVLCLPDDGQEILVIDNHPSTAQSRDIVGQYSKIRYICEDRSGLDVARNRALREARTDVVAFIDDDAVPDPNWLRALQAGFTDPQKMCVTGLTMPAQLETEAQEMFERYSAFSRGFKRKAFSRQIINPLNAHLVGAGANMALRRDVLEKIGAFDEALDAGTASQSGGDTEMFSRILRCGYEIVYEPAALNWHRHRRTWPELEKVIYGYGVGVYATWTRKILFDREPGVIKLAFSWFWRYQLPGLVRALLRRQGSFPADLLTAELRGCLRGPGAYLNARNKAIQSKGVTG